MFHFRVAAFYIPLLVIALVWELWKARGEKRVVPVLLGILVVGAAALVVVTPALWEALRIYVSERLAFIDVEVAAGAEETARTVQLYYEFDWRSVPILAARPWLLILGACSAGIALLRRNRLAIACLVWIVSLYLIGSAYRLGVPLLSVTNMGAILIMLYLPIGMIVGSAAEEALRLLGPRGRERAVRSVVALVLIAGFVGSHSRVTDIEPFRYFVTPEDVLAMDWIRANTPADALFAVNTFFWLPRAPHGTDAGCWIPYFTGRQTTVGVMLFHLAAEQYASRIIEVSRAVERLEADDVSLTDLLALGVDYVYVGQRGDFSGSGLNAAKLSQAEGVDLVYQNGGASILQIRPAD